MSNAVENDVVGGNSPVDKRNWGNSSEVVANEAMMTPSSSVQRMVLTDTPKARNSMKRSSAFCIDSDEEEENVPPPSKIKKAASTYTLVWNIEDVDEQTELSVVADMPLKQEVSVVLGCWCPTVMLPWPNTQKVMTYDKNNVVYPLNFERVGGDLPELHRGMILKIHGVIVSEVTFSSPVLGHHLLLTAKKSVNVTIIRGPVNVLLNEGPENHSLGSLRQGKPRSISYIRILRIGEVNDVRVYWSVERIERRTMTVIYNYEKRATLIFNEQYIDHSECLKVGELYHFYGLRVKRTKRDIQLFPTPKFSWSNASTEAPAPSQSIDE